MTMEELIVRMVSDESVDDEARVAAAHLYFAVTYHFGLDMVSRLDPPDFAEIFSLRDDG